MLWWSQEESNRNCQRRLVLCSYQSADRWSVSPKDGIDAKPYMGSRGEWTRTQKRNTLRISDSKIMSNAGNPLEIVRISESIWDCFLHLFRCSLVQCYRQYSCSYLWCVLEQQLRNILIHTWIMSKVHMSCSCVTGTTWLHMKQEHSMSVSFFPTSFTPPPQQYCRSSCLCYSSLGQRMNDVCISLKESLFEGIPLWTAFWVPT